MTRHAAPGEWPPALGPGDPGDVRDVARLPNAGRVSLDPAVARVAELLGPATKGELLGRLAADLEFPSWFGSNWDALEEVLRDDRDGRAIVILWHGADRLATTDRAAARDILRVVARDRRERGLRPLVAWLAPSLPHEDESMSNAANRTSRVPDHIRSLGKIHHVALIVASLEGALGLWRDFLGLELETVMDIAHDRVRIAFLGVGESKIELVEPTDDTTGVARFLASKGEGFHHVCFEVANLAETLLRLELDGLELIDTAPRRGAEGPVAFLHPRSCHGVLVELIEAPGGPSWSSLGFPGGT